MSTLATPPAQVGRPRIFSRLAVRMILRPVERLAAVLRNRCAIRRLHRLDDRMLADIGLRRTGIAEAVRSGRR